MGEGLSCIILQFRCYKKESEVKVRQRKRNILLLEWGQVFIWDTSGPIMDCGYKKEEIEYLTLERETERVGERWKIDEGGQLSCWETHLLHKGVCCSFLVTTTLLTITVNSFDSDIPHKQWIIKGNKNRPRAQHTLTKKTKTKLQDNFLSFFHACIYTSI